MDFKQKEVALKDGRRAILRAPKAAEAEEMNAFLKKCTAETDFLLRCSEECVETIEQEAAFLTNILLSENSLMIVCEVDGRIAGNCNVGFNTRLKTKHRATVGIGLLREFWNLGIGTALFNEMIAAATARGITQMELDFLEGNSRAQALYEKMGFHIVCEKPRAIRLKDGTYLNEMFMVKELDK